MKGRLSRKAELKYERYAYAIVIIAFLAAVILTEKKSSNFYKDWRHESITSKVD